MYLFIFGCMWAFSSCGKQELLSWQHVGFCLGWPLLLWSTGSNHAGFSGCSAQAWWDPPKPGLYPVSLALQDGFLATRLPGKSHCFCFCFSCNSRISMTWRDYPLFKRCPEDGHRAVAISHLISSSRACIPNWVLRVDFSW